jgi:hypothetical protein
MSLMLRETVMRAFVWITPFILVAAVTTGIAQNSEAPDMVTRKVRLRGGEDTNVKLAPEVNVRNKPSDVAPPAGKSPAGKPQCAIKFDNHTDLIVKTYIDGHFAGTIRPYGALDASTPPGSVLLYAKAEYDDGSADAWGAIRVSCRTKYLWRLAD